MRSYEVQAEKGFYSRIEMLKLSLQPFRWVRLLLAYYFT